MPANRALFIGRPGRAGVNYFDTASAGEKENTSVVDTASVLTSATFRDPVSDKNQEKKAEPTPQGDVGCFSVGSSGSTTDDNASMSSDPSKIQLADRIKSKRNLLDLRQETKSNASVVESLFVSGAQTLLGLTGPSAEEEAAAKAKAAAERANTWDRDLDYSFNDAGTEPADQPAPPRSIVDPLKAAPKMRFALPSYEEAAPAAPSPPAASRLPPPRPVMSPPPPPPTASAYTPPPPPPTGTTPNRSPAAPLDADLLDRMKTDQALYASIQAQQRLLLLQAERDAADLAALRSQLLARAQRDSLDLQALRNEQDERDMAHRRDIAALMRQIEELKAAKAVAAAAGAGGASPGGADAATVAALRRRIAELEAVNHSLDRRLAESEAARRKGASSSATLSPDALRALQDEIRGLKDELVALRARNAALEAELAKQKEKAAEQARQAKADAATIAALRQQVDDLRRKESNAEDLRRKRLLDLTEVNATLKQLAKDKAFQSDLKRPLVKVALDCWGGSAAGHTPEEVEEARFDDGVGRVFPRMKAFEAVCDAAKIKFPVDHIIAGKTLLSQEAIREAFGPDFVVTTITGKSL